MKTMSEFVNLSLKEQFEELNKGRWPKPEVRIPAPNTEARRKAQEARIEFDKLSLSDYSQGYLDGFVEGAMKALEQKEKIQ